MIIRAIVCLRARTEAGRASRLTKALLAIVGLLSASRKLHTLLSTIAVHLSKDKQKLLIELEAVEGAKGPLEAALAVVQDIADCRIRECSRQKRCHRTERRRYWRKPLDLPIQYGVS